MKNKIIFCLLSLIVCLNILKPFAVSADALAMDPSMIASLGDLGMALLGGAKFNFTGSKYKIDDTSSLDAYQQAQLQAQEFLRDYAIMRGIPYPDFSGNPPVITDTKSFVKTFYFNSTVNQIYNNYRKAQTDQEREDAMVFELSNPALASWMNYDVNWYKKYINDFSTDEPVLEYEDPPQGLQNLVNSISSRNVTNLNVPFPGYQGNFSVTSNDLTIVGDVNLNYTNRYGYYGVCNPTTVYINNTGVDNYVEVIYSGLIYADGIFYRNNYYQQGLFQLVNNSYFNFNSSSNVNLIGLQNSFADIIACLQYLNDHIRNCNLVVNGKIWADVSMPDVPTPTIPDFPDVIDSNTDDPAYDIVVPDTVDNKGYFDLTSILDALTNAILGSSDLDDSTDATIEADDVVVLDIDKEVTDTKVEDPDKIIDDEIGLDKKLPIIPIPPDVSDAFAGTSILAELIDGTQTVLPDELITVFWGIVCTIFIIGVIRVMHK